MLAICALNVPAASPNYLEYARVCVGSARRCGYEPVLLLDADADGLSLVASLVNARCVTVRSRFYALMQKHLRPDELLIAQGAMLRLEIPRLFDDEYVVYTDVDVIHRRKLDFVPVKYWGMVHEFDAAGHCNSGVSLMNLPNLRATQDVFDIFIEAIIAGGHLPKVCWDQGLINLFYGKLIERIPDEWNWRPYWGKNENAGILHFHGPKPMDTQERIDKEYPPQLRPPYFYEAAAEWKAMRAAI